MRDMGIYFHGADVQLNKGEVDKKKVCQKQNNSGDGLFTHSSPSLSPSASHLLL